MSQFPVTYNRMDVVPEAKTCYYTDTVSYAGIRALVIIIFVYPLNSPGAKVHPERASSHHSLNNGGYVFCRHSNLRFFL